MFAPHIWVRIRGEAFVGHRGDMFKSTLMRKGFALSLAFLFFPLLTVAQDVPNQSGLRLVTSPIPVTLSTVPERPVTADLKVKNDGLYPEKLKLGIMKFQAYEESGQPALLEITPEDTFANWVTFSEPEFTVAPGEWKSIRVTINPPKESAFGYYYAFVFSRAEVPKPTPGQATLTGGSAVLVLLDVAVPGAKRSVVLDSFTTDRKIYEFLPVNFSARLHNNGNVHAAPRGNIFIKNSQGKEVALLEVNFQKGNILPNSKRIFEASWDQGFPLYKNRVIDNAVVRDEEGDIIQDLEWNFTELNNLRMGRYTASLVMVYDDGFRDVPIEGEVSFWILPWRILAAGFLVISLVLFGFYSLLRSLFGKMRGGK